MDLASQSKDRPIEACRRRCSAAVFDYCSTIVPHSQREVEPLVRRPAYATAPVPKSNEDALGASALIDQKTNSVV
jgi:hypothetical protein